MNSNEEVVESSSASKSSSNRETTASQQDSTATAIRGDPAPTNKDVSKDETLDPKTAEVSAKKSISEDTAPEEKKIQGMAGEQTTTGESNKSASESPASEQPTTTNKKPSNLTKGPPTLNDGPIVTKCVQSIISLLERYGPLTLPQLEFNVPPLVGEQVQQHQFIDVIDLLVTLGVLQKLQLPSATPSSSIEKNLTDENANTSSAPKETTRIVYGIQRGHLRRSVVTPANVMTEAMKAQAEWKASQRRQDILIAALSEKDGQQQHPREVLKTILLKYPEVAYDPVYIAALRNLHVDVNMLLGDAAASSTATTTATSADSVGNGRKGNVATASSKSNKTKAPKLKQKRKRSVNPDGSDTPVPGGGKKRKTKKGGDTTNQSSTTAAAAGKEAAGGVAKDTSSSKMIQSAVSSGGAQTTMVHKSDAEKGDVLVSSGAKDNVEVAVSLKPTAPAVQTDPAAATSLTSNTSASSNAPLSISSAGKTEVDAKGIGDMTAVASGTTGLL